MAFPVDRKVRRARSFRSEAQRHERAVLGRIAVLRSQPKKINAFAVRRRISKRSHVNQRGMFRRKIARSEFSPESDAAEKQGRDEDSQGVPEGLQYHATGQDGSSGPAVTALENSNPFRVSILQQKMVC